MYFKELGDRIRLTSERSPIDISINTVQELLKQEMRARKYSRVVIDSLTSLRYFYIKTSEENASLISFFRLLSDLGVTTIVTVQLPEISKPDVEAQMARGEIKLHKWFDGRGLMRGVTVEKYRGSGHDPNFRLMKITSEGIVVKMGSPKKGDAEEEPEQQDANENPGRQKKAIVTPPPKETPPPAEVVSAPPPHEPIPAPPPSQPAALPPTQRKAEGSPEGKTT